jgi:hypothetical protein
MSRWLVNWRGLVMTSFMSSLITRLRTLNAGLLVFAASMQPRLVASEYHNLLGSDSRLPDFTGFDSPNRLDEPSSRRLRR